LVIKWQPAQKVSDSLVGLAIEPESEYVVRRVASFLSGYASAWYMQQVAQAEQYPFSKFSEFKSALLVRFANNCDQQSARNTLKSVKQVGSINDYSSAFLDALANIDHMQELDQIELFLVYISGLANMFSWRVDAKVQRFVGGSSYRSGD
jgi:hypothetical protein